MPRCGVPAFRFDPHGVLLGWQQPRLVVLRSGVPTPRQEYRSGHCLPQRAEGREPYKGVIWEKRDDELLDSKWDIESLDDNEPHAVAPESVPVATTEVAETPKFDN